MSDLPPRPVAAPNGATTVAAVIGDPIAHSRSPAIFNAAFAALGLDWVYAAFRVPEGSGTAAVEAARTLGLAGLSVTMPLKHEVLPALDHLSDTATRLGAVNCISRAGDRLGGHNTDGDGYLASLAADGVEVTGANCVVLGAGGAARAVVLALATAGAAEVVVVNRSPDRGLEAAGLAGPVGRALGPAGLARAMTTADLVVNATPVGMSQGDASPVPAEWLGPHLMVSDLIYHPVRTPLIAAGEAAGAKVANGLGMLVHQAAAALRIWTGSEPPIGVMTAAARHDPVSGGSAGVDAEN